MPNQPTKNSVNKDDVDAPVAELVQMAHAAVLRQQEVYAGQVDIAKLLVQVAQRLRCRESNQEIGVLLPRGKDAHPAGPVDGLMGLLVQADVCQNFTCEGEYMSTMFTRGRGKQGEAYQ